MIKPKFSIIRSLSYSARHLRPQQRIEIKTLEDLAKLKSIDDVDPELIRQLINERTNELNIKNELDMLKQFQSEEKQHQEISLSKFVRPMWIFLLMSSFVYLTGHFVWWKLEYDEREIELDKEVQTLEAELSSLMAQKADEEKNNKDLTGETVSSTTSQQPERKWYRRWF